MGKRDRRMGIIIERARGSPRRGGVYARDGRGVNVSVTRLTVTQY